MTLTINHNLMAMNSARNLGMNYGKLATSTRRLSSGLRVGTAADDAAGLAIRELMRADISTMNQGIRNANDAISMVQVADGALSVIDEKLIRMKELAEQAATGTYNAAQRAMINSEYQAMALEIQRISEATDFNGVHLLNGNLSGTHDGSGLQSTGAAKVHFGTGNDSAEDYYYVNVNSTNIENMFDPDGNAIGTFEEDGNLFFEPNEEDIVVNTFTAGTQNVPEVVSIDGGGFICVWASENQFSGSRDIVGQTFDSNGSKVGAEYLVNTDTANNKASPKITSLSDGNIIATWASEGQDGSGWGVYAQKLDANGNKIGNEFLVNTSTANNQASPDVISLTDNRYMINWQSNQTGTLETYGKIYNNNGSVAKDEYNISVGPATQPWAARLAQSSTSGNIMETYNAQDGNDWGVFTQLMDSNGNTIGSEELVHDTNYLLQTRSDVTSLSDGKFAVSYMNVDTRGFALEGRVTVQLFNDDGSKYGSPIVVNDELMTPPRMEANTRISSVDDGFVVSWTQNDGANGDQAMLQLFDNDGRPIDGNSKFNVTDDGAQQNMGIAQLDTGGFVALYTSDESGNLNVHARVFSPVVSVLSQSQAQDSLERINDAIIYKDKIRADLGATQNRLENTINNLAIQSENLQAAESRISDVDVTQEMTEFVRTQILTQSAVAMLAQANSLPRMAMQLIGGG